MVLPVELRAVAEQMDMGSDRMTAYINRKTGELAVVDEEEFSFSENTGASEDCPEWYQEMIADAKEITENDDWIELPDRYDVHEYAIMEQFCYSVDDQRIQASLLRAIGGKGAFRRFKDRVSELDVEKDWYDFKDGALKRIAADFLESEDIAFVDTPEQSGS